MQPRKKKPARLAQLVAYGSYSFTLLVTGEKMSNEYWLTVSVKRAQEK